MNNLVFAKFMKGVWKHGDIQPIDSVEAHVCGTTKDIVCKKEETKWNNTARKSKKLLT